MLQHMDNFTPYGLSGAARMLNGVYAENAGCDLLADPDSNAPAGSIALIVASSGGYTGARYILSAEQEEVGLLSRVWMPFVPDTDIVGNAVTGTTPTWEWRDVSNNPICTLVVRANAGLSLLTNLGGTVIETTSGPVITSNAWWHIEAEIIRTSPTSIDYEVRVEGVTVLSGSGTVTNANDIAQVFYGNKSFALRNYWFKDIVIRDGTGTRNTGFLGSVTVVSLVPNSDISTGWTPSTGTLHYPLVDNSPPVDATDYVTAPYPPPSHDQYGLTSLPDDVTSVKGIMTFVRARKTDGGDGNLQVSMVSNGDVANGADRPITAAFTYWRDLFEEDPDTSSPWLPGAVDVAELRINRTL